MTSLDEWRNTAAELGFTESPEPDPLYEAFKAVVRLEREYRQKLTDSQRLETEGYRIKHGPCAKARDVLYDIVDSAGVDPAQVEDYIQQAVSRRRT